MHLGFLATLSLLARVFLKYGSITDPAIAFRSRYEITSTFLDILLRILMPDRHRNDKSYFVTPVYFTKRGKLLIFILAGGDKSTQAKDIQTAIKLASTLSEVFSLEPRKSP